MCCGCGGINGLGAVLAYSDPSRGLYAKVTLYAGKETVMDMLETRTSQVYTDRSASFDGPTIAYDSTRIGTYAPHLPKSITPPAWTPPERVSGPEPTTPPATREDPVPYRGIEQGALETTRTYRWQGDLAERIHDAREQTRQSREKERAASQSALEGIREELRRATVERQVLDHD